MSSQTATSLNGSARLGSYLRRLRAGYGYSLRRVEERARAEGGEIDNSQLSRYEKGVCYPSFDKLRILASIFNVSIQSFSDVVELEAFEHLKPETGSPTDLLADGTAALQEGDSGRAFAYYDLALESLLEKERGVERDRLLGEIRVHRAIALRRLGKLSLAEQELRSALRRIDSLTPALRTQAVLTLSGIHASQGERFLSEIEALRAHQMADEAGLDRFAAMAMAQLSNVLSDQSRHEEAVTRAREAAALYARVGDGYEAIRLRINIATNYVAMDKVREGMRLLTAAIADARRGRHRRLEALAWSNLGEAYYRNGGRDKARECLRQSNSLANTDSKTEFDILFFNAFYDWKMAEIDDNPTRARIAFGRLKALRSNLERQFTEVEQFDSHVKRGRAHA